MRLQAWRYGDVATLLRTTLIFGPILGLGWALALSAHFGDNVGDAFWPFGLGFGFAVGAFVGLALIVTSPHAVTRTVVGERDRREMLRALEHAMDPWRADVRSDDYWIFRPRSWLGMRARVRVSLEGPTVTVSGSRDRVAIAVAALKDGASYIAVQNGGVR